MSDIMGTDDMLALFNGAPIMLQQNIDLQLSQSVDLIGCSELMLSKHEAVPVVILEDGQVALQMNSGMCKKNVVYTLLEGTVCHVYI